VVSSPQTFYVNVSDLNGCRSVDSIKVNPVIATSQTIDLSAYPNPTGKKTKIKFSMHTEQIVSLVVYQTNGIKVANLFAGKASAHQVYQVGFDASGLAGGVYVVKLSTANEEKSLKLLVTQ
jgi:hypothetical protein